MNATTTRPGDYPGAARSGLAHHWTAVLPDALQLVAGRSPIVLLPPKFAGEPLTACECGGLLVYIRGAWHHTDACLDCTSSPGEPCQWRHVGCSQPEPATCQHGCGEPVSLADRCALDGAPRSCCNCCWDLR